LGCTYRNREGTGPKSPKIAARPGDIKHSYANMERTVDILGLQPEVELK
jgi:hypothetical protein